MTNQGSPYMYVCTSSSIDVNRPLIYKILIIYTVSSMTKVYPQMTILCVFVLCFLSVYTVYRVLTVYIIEAMSETEILSCYVAMVSLL